MKKNLSLFLIILSVLFLASCSTNTRLAESSDVQQEEKTVRSENEDTAIQSSEDLKTAESDTVTDDVENNQMKLQIGDYIFTANLADNSSAKALMEMLKAGPITIEMQDYGGMEKVGSLGTSLPENDEQITTEFGDLILYQGNAFVIYYAPNSWNFTRLGKINGVTQEELKEALGSGDVQVTLSMN